MPVNPYQPNAYLRNSLSKDTFKQGKNMVLSKDLSEERKNRYKSWTTFFRNNMGLFVMFYMGVRLYPYQRYWMTLMGKSTSFLAVASRASAKSWMIAVYSIAKCILYPGTIVSISSSTKAQAGLILSQHCKALYNEYPNIQRETANIVLNQNTWLHTFLNGSKIEVVISGEAGRGFRSTTCVLEERRLLSTEVINSIIRPFLVSRIAPFMKKPEYANYPREEAQEIVITSSYYRSYGEWWSEAKKLLERVRDGDPDVKIIILDYLISLKHKIKSVKQLRSERAKMDDITFLMEYGNLAYAASQSAFFKVSFFDRTIKIGWRPQRDIPGEHLRKNPYDIPRKPGERRIVSADMAMRKGARNDNTVICCARIFPTKKGWVTEIPYIESMNGQNSIYQALRIKQLYSEFTNFSPDDCLVLDVANSGIAVYDSLTSITKDDGRGVEYPAMKVMRHSSIDQGVFDELSERTLGNNALECIYPISASQVLNSQIAISFRDRLKRKMLRFLVDDTAEEEFLVKTGNKDILDQEDIGTKAYLLSGNFQTSLLINECISLEMMVLPSGGVKLEEAGNARKDRYTSCSYLNWYVSLLDNELLKEADSSSDEEAILAVTYIR